MLPEFRGSITCERLCTDVNRLFVFYWTRFTSVNGKRKYKTTTEWTTSDQWSQQQSALVSRIKSNFATRSLKGPCFSASCCQIFEGELHVNACAQMWTVIFCTKITSANGNCKQKTTEETTTESTTSDHSSSQLWEAESKYNFATRSLKGPCFSASCCQNCEGESHVNNCEHPFVA